MTQTQQVTGDTSFIVHIGYSGKKNSTLTVRNPVTIDEMDRHCTADTHIWLLDNYGEARRVKVNGKVRRWKRDRDRIEVPYKYGLYEYGTLTERDIDRVLIVVE